MKWHIENLRSAVAANVALLEKRVKERPSALERLGSLLTALQSVLAVLSAVLSAWSSDDDDDAPVKRDPRVSSDDNDVHDTPDEHEPPRR